MNVMIISFIDLISSFLREPGALHRKKRFARDRSQQRRLSRPQQSVGPDLLKRQDREVK
jgi:hypothetical protein